MKTSRRAFLKLFVGTVAVATLPLPRFLLNQSQKNELDGLNRLLEYGTFGGAKSFDARGSVLTVETIEEAAKRSAMNMDQPDRILMSKRDYKKLARHFGYKLVYSGDEIIIWPLRS